MFYNLDFNKKRLTHEVTGVQVWTGEWICCWISPGLAVVVKLGPSITGGGCIATGQDSDIGHNSTYTHTHTRLLSLGLFWFWVFFLRVTSMIVFLGGGGGTGGSWTNREWVRFQQRKLCKEQILTWPSSARRTFHMRTRSGTYPRVFGTFATSQGFFFVDAESFLMLKSFLITEPIYRTRAFQICGLVRRHFQHHLFILSHQSFSAGREARVCGVPHGPELPGCTGALGFSHRQR